MSSNIPDPTPWLVDPDTMRAMRRAHAEQALLDADFARSLVESEELLAESPSDAHALWITARASLALGDACMAEAALDQLLDHPADDRPATVAQVQAELAFARFLQADFAAARATAATALALDRELPAAWVYLGLAEDRLGRPTEALQAFERAEALSPGSAPREAPSPSPGTWPRVLAAAMDRLSPDEAGMLDGLQVTWADLPDATLLTSVAPPISPFVEALISGNDPTPAEAALPEADGDGDGVAPADVQALADDSPLEQLDAALRQAIPTPTSLAVYTRNLLRGEPTTADLVERLAVALRAEIAAWLGVSPDDLTPPAE